MARTDLAMPKLDFQKYLCDQSLTEKRFKELVGRTKETFITSENPMIISEYISKRNDELETLIKLSVLERSDNGDVCLSPFVNARLPKCWHEVWILGSLLRKDPDTFYYLPQTDIFYGDQNKDNKNEIDFICVFNGRLIVGESKRSSSGFTVDIINNLLKIAQHIRADIVMLAYETDDTNIKNFTSNIDTFGIEIQFKQIFE